MSTQPIEHKGYGYAFKQARRPQEDVDFPLGPESSKKRQEEAAAPRQTVRDQIRLLLADVPKHDGNRLSFKDVADYRDVLEQDWDAVVTSDLRGLGVNMDYKFRLVHEGASGTITANSEHPDKQKIDQYFASDSEAATDFDTILKLGKLIDVAERKLSPEQMNQDLDAEAMAWWYQTNMDTATLFTGGGIVFGMGHSAYKGLDIRV